MFLVYMLMWFQWYGFTCILLTIFSKFCTNYTLLPGACRCIFIEICVFEGQGTRKEKCWNNSNEFEFELNGVIWSLLCFWTTFKAEMYHSFYQICSNIEVYPGIVNNVEHFCSLPSSNSHLVFIQDQNFYTRIGLSQRKRCYRTSKLQNSPTYEFLDYVNLIEIMLLYSLFLMCSTS